jgi:hypothetical protein
MHMPDAPWFVQPAVGAVKNQSFTARVYFGDADTPAGTRFQLAVLVTKSKAAAEQFKEGQQLNALPTGLPCSKVITVSRGG